MKKLIIPIFSLLLLLPACKQTEQTEETVAEIEAAQMQGREAARRFVGKEWKDTLQLQRQLLEMRSIQSKYVIEKKTRSAEAFDSTFVSTMKTVRPDLGMVLEEHYLKQIRK